MNENILKDIINVNKNYIIPNYVIKYYDKLNLENKELILLTYLLNQKENVIFDLERISNDIYIQTNEVLDLINSLNEKNYISIEMKKNNGVIEEFISLELFYNKIFSFIIDNKEENASNDIFMLIEQEFGRTLSPMECETINGWKEKNISEELIKSALKEAVLSGVTNLKYIDRILIEWTKKGYKSSEDIKSTKIKKEDNYVEEIYDYDWINDN